MKIRLTILLLIGIWVGMVLGLSFIEAPLKFTAPGITTKLGLGIGKIVFGISNKIQLGFLALLIIALILNAFELSSIGKLGILFLSIIVLIQTIYLMPILDERADLTIEGQILSSSYHHLAFIGFEIVKIISLIFLFFNIK